MSHKDNENNIENGFIFMEKGKSMFHVKHFWISILKSDILESCEIREGDN